MQQVIAQNFIETRTISHSSHMINGNFMGKDIVSLDQFSTEDLRVLVSARERDETYRGEKEPSNLLAGHIISLLFFEPSSRTFGRSRRR